MKTQAEVDAFAEAEIDAQIAEARRAPKDNPLKELRLQFPDGHVVTTTPDDIE